MAQRIHLAAILEREGKLLLLREAGEPGWSLPGGDLLPEHADVDVGMAAILGEMGITVEGIEEAFYETLFIPTAEGHTVFNLFATSAWEGEPAVGDAVEVAWTEAGALADLPMDEHVRAGVLAAFGLAEPRDD
ncbi:MAG: hypothetical protein F4Z77_05920, partial [Dehalococcoidia bacterium]|nr:hypothetical protein [Dehalococcoidia bacterium]